jgi:hypothetical protein
MRVDRCGWRSDHFWGCFEHENCGEIIVKTIAEQMKLHLMIWSWRMTVGPTSRRAGKLEWQNIRESFF